MNRMLSVATTVVGLVALATATSPAETRSPEAEATFAEIESIFGFVPTLFKTVPDEAVSGAWEALRDLEFNPNTAIPGKYKSLIALAVAAQVPCNYCVYIDTESARAAGASEREIREAVGMAALTRQWSTVLNGGNLDQEAFRKDIAGILAHVAENTDATPPSVKVTGAASAYRDMEATLGRVPGFMRAFPELAIAGAWKEFKGLQMNPNTAIPGKYKELIGLAVASQIPCGYCIEGHTEFASSMGATNAEFSEAVAMAALVRHWSTVANGSQQDIEEFKAEADRMLRAAGEHAEAH